MNKSQHDDLSMSQNQQQIGVDLQMNVFKTLEANNDVLDVASHEGPAKTIEQPDENLMRRSASSRRFL